MKLVSKVMILKQTSEGWVCWDYITWCKYAPLEMYLCASEVVKSSIICRFFSKSVGITLNSIRDSISKTERTFLSLFFFFWGGGLSSGGSPFSFSISH